MFKPNRIGTATIWDPDGFNATTTQFTLQDTQPEDLGINIINATPIGDFGMAGIRRSGTPTTIPDDDYVAFGLQFQVSEPVEGDTVGIEMIGSFRAFAHGQLDIVPVFGKLNAPAETLFGQAFFYEHPIQIEQPTIISSADSELIRSHYFKTQLLVRNQFGDGGEPIAGTYAFGYHIYNVTGSNKTLGEVIAHLSVRQLNDQQTVGYRDTLR